MQFVRRCYGLRGIYGRFDSKIRFEIESDGRFEIRFECKKTIRRSLVFLHRCLPFVTVNFYTKHFSGQLELSLLNVCLCIVNNFPVK